MLYGSKGILNLARRRAENGRNGEGGQILILFCLVIVVLMVSASIVIDVGLLRTDTARLQNALDAGALAGGHYLPATSANVGAVTGKAQSFTTSNYPGLGNPNVNYACLIGLDTATDLPRVTDMPSVCKVSFAANSSQWICTAIVCWAPCTPATVSTDVCNTIMLDDSASQPYGFGRVVGINSGNTGTKTAAACTGACGQPPIVPVDVVVILDRTGSMDSSASVANLRNGARTVLSVFDPTLQRVALGFTGPSSIYNTTNGNYGSDSSSLPSGTCMAPHNYVHALSLDPGATAPGTTPAYGSTSSGNNGSAGGTSLTLPRPSGTSNGDFLLATIAVDGGSGSSVTTLAGWTRIGTQTNSGTNLAVTTYRKFAGGSEPANYVWTLSNNRAVGSIVRYTGVYTATPIDDNSANSSTTNGTSVTANAVSPSSVNSALVGVYATDASGAFTIGSLTERLDVANPNANGPTLMVATGSQAATGTTGTKVATASVSNKWVAQLIALTAVPGPADVYGTNTAADIGQWIPLGYTSTDSESPAQAYNEAYSDASGLLAGVSTGTHLYEAIGCFDVSGTGTNLARPLMMAQAYLAANARTVNGKPVKQGIILETDGAPNNGGYGPASDYTSAGVTAAATAAKTAGIELFTIGYGVDSSTITLLAGMATNSAVAPGFQLTNAGDVAAENADGDHFFVKPIAGDLSAVLRAAAAALVGGTRLVQMYPQPVISSVSPSSGIDKNGGTGISITGKYFTDAYAVTVNGLNVTSFTVVSDTQINAVAPAGPANTQVHVQVSTPGGSSKLVNGDRVTYGP